jgi:hypothetical protein
MVRSGMRGDLNAFGQLVAGAIVSALGLGVLLWRLMLGAEWTFMDGVFVFLCFWGGVPNVIAGVLKLTPTSPSADAVETDDPNRLAGKEPASTPWGFIAVCALFSILAIIGSVVEIVRYYSTGVGDEPPLLMLVIATLVLALIVWNWFPRRRRPPPS